MWREPPCHPTQSLLKLYDYNWEVVLYILLPLWTVKQNNGGLTLHYFLVNNWYHNRISLDMLITIMTVRAIWAEIVSPPVYCSAGEAGIVCWILYDMKMYAHYPEFRTILYTLLSPRRLQHSTTSNPLFVEMIFRHFDPCFPFANSHFFCAVIPKMHVCLKVRPYTPANFRFDHQLYNRR